MTVCMADYNVELRASICVRVISLCVSVRIPLTDTLDSDLYADSTLVDAFLPLDVDPFVVGDIDLHTAALFPDVVYE